MSLGAMTWTCLLLAAGAAQPDVWHLNQKAFQIPIRFDAQRRAEIKELDLWVSRDKGQTWNLAGRATSDKEFFPYAVTEDGPYWFTMAVIDLKGKQEPANVMTAPVGQKIEVDTVKPDIKLTAERQGDSIVVNWAITEQHPNPDTLKLEYAESADGPWTALSIAPGPNGNTKFQNPAAVMVRMQMQDLAENVGQAIKQAPAAGASGVAFVLPPPPPLTTPNPPPPPLSPPTLPGPSTALSGPLPPPVPPPSDPPSAPTPLDSGAGVGTWNPRVSDSAPPRLPAPPTASPPSLLASDGGPPTTPPPGPQPTPLAVASGAKTGAQTVAYSTQPAGMPVSPPPGALTPDSPAPMRGALPPLQIVNKRQLKLEFDVGKFGPSGLGGVDVYVTTDDGATWEKSAVDPNASLPAAGEGRPGAVRGSVTVQLPKEGVAYGFYVVVKSRAGLGKPPPHTGDTPHLRVELDTTPPEASLFQPQPDPKQRDTLILTWQATDKNLATNPITLEWSAQPGPDAQWNYIGDAAELPNTGRYAWPIKNNVPPNVYLRLTVRDVAGNKAVAQTTEPVLIDLSVPEVSNIGLSGAGQAAVGVGIVPVADPR